MKLKQNDAGSSRSTRSFLIKTANSDAKTQADLSSSSPLYLRGSRDSRRGASGGGSGSDGRRCLVSLVAR